MNIYENISVNEGIKRYLENKYSQPLVSAFLYKNEEILVYNGIQIPIKCSEYGVCTLETSVGESIVFQGGRIRKTRRRKTRRRKTRRRSRRVRH